MNVANKLTMLRVLMIPVYLVLWSLDTAWSGYAALAVFVLASLTDLLDGQIARSRGLVTDFGKFMDPLADKVLVMTAMVCFCAAGRFPAWALVIVMIGLCVMHLTVPTLVDQLCIWVIVLTTIYSGVEYFIKNKDCIDWKNL